MTDPSNDNATAGVVAELRRTPGWPNLGNAAADAITALQAKLAEVESERDALIETALEKYHATRLETMTLSSLLEKVEAEREALQAQVREAQTKMLDACAGYINMTYGISALYNPIDRKRVMDSLTPTVSDAAEEGDKV